MAKLPPSEPEDDTDDNIIQDIDKDVQYNHTHHAELLQLLTDLDVLSQPLYVYNRMTTKNCQEEGSWKVWQTYLSCYMQVTTTYVLLGQ